MDLFRALDKHQGLARTRTLRRLGVSEHSIRRAVAGGHVVRLRRGWVASRSADPMLVTAAEQGLIVTCITAAARKGLWVLDSSRPHVAAPSHAGHVEVERSVIHWNRPVFPRDPDSCEDTIENTLVMVARCQPYESALATWESAFQKRLVDPVVLERAPLPSSVRRILLDARPFADAGTETIFRTRLRWVNVRITPQVWILGHRVDFVIGERLIIQIDGGHHVGAQRTSDIAHDALLMLHGYHVIRIGYDQLINQWASVQDLILTAIAQRLHLP